ncbi:glycosyltransferase family 2 protein [Paenibacillus sp. S-38]|uniref:glycosyltransferase family 2 protein n=1 Tax=Paenibacillus sp. S-38 TaxID=3416710 RepID=UPI003CEEC377
MIRDIHRHLPSVDVIVVNDGSTDRTEEVAKEAGAQVLTLPYNVGIGGGMQTGYLYAREMGYDFALQMDSDGQHRPREAAKLLAQAVNYDLVIGSRYVKSTSYRSTLMR